MNVYNLFKNGRKRQIFDGVAQETMNIFFTKLGGGLKERVDQNTYEWRNLGRNVLKEVNFPALYEDEDSLIGVEVWTVRFDLVGNENYIFEFTAIHQIGLKWLKTTNTG